MAHDLIIRNGTVADGTAGASLIDVPGRAGTPVLDVDSCKPTAGALPQDATMVGAMAGIVSSSSRTRATGR